MYYIIAVFKNRTESYLFLSLIKSYNVNAKIINTPTELKMPCGISVSLPIESFYIANQILQRRHFSYFAGFYKIWQTNNSIRVLPVNF